MGKLSLQSVQFHLENNSTHAERFILRQDLSFTDLNQNIMTSHLDKEKKESKKQLWEYIDWILIFSE